MQTFVQWRTEGRRAQGEVRGRQMQDSGSFDEEKSLKDCCCFFQSASSCFFQFLPVRAQRQPTGDEQHPEPGHHASFCGCRRGGRCETKHGRPPASRTPQCSPTVLLSQWTEWFPTCSASGCGATAQAPGRPSGEGLRGASLTSWKPQRNPDPQRAKFQNQPPFPACLSSSPLVDVSST